jgi:GntR family transcriptional regulator of arabinose operon
LDKERQPKYQQLKKYLLEEILMDRIKPNEQIPSENELAEKFSLSRQTVRKAISILVNEGYLYSEHGRGTYCKDRRRKRKEGGNIAVIATQISDYIFPRLIQGIDNVVHNHGFSIFLKNTENNAEREAYCLEEMLKKSVEGLIIEPTMSALYPQNIKYYEAFDKNRIPYVFIHGCYRSMEDRPCVAVDDVAGMYKIVEYLLKLGHKSIIGIFKADEIQGLSRHIGYAKALASYGILYDPDKVVWFFNEDKDTMPYAAIRKLLDAGVSFDAVTCYNDQVAYRVVHVLQDAGLAVPSDISVTGFDDSYLAVSCPVKLTTMNHPKEKLGEAAAEMLFRVIESNSISNIAEKKIIIPDLIVRDSCIQR